MKTIFVTGSAGFIGARTSEALLESGESVVGIDNMNDYYDVRMKEYRLEKLKKYPNFKYYRGDIENLETLDKIFTENQIEAIINLAARAGVGYSMINPHVYLTTNTHGSLNLMEMMRKHEIKKIVLASTSSIYAGQKMPFREDLAVNTPISPYAAAKKGAELMAYTYNYLFDLDVSVLRYFTVYGPAGRPDMSIFRFIKWIDQGDPIELFGDGTQSRDFTFVDDIAAGTIKALQPLGYEIMNIGGGQNPFSLNYMIEKIEEFLGKKAKIDYKPFQKTDIKETWADITKAKDLLGWRPHTPFDEGLKITVDWYLENKSWLKDIKL